MEKAAMCHKGTDWQTSASCLIYLFLLKKGKGYRANSSLQSPHSLNKPNGGCWQGIDSLLMKEFLTKWQPVWDAVWRRILPQASTK